MSKNRKMIKQAKCFLRIKLKVKSRRKKTIKVVFYIWQDITKIDK